MNTNESAFGGEGLWIFALLLLFGMGGFGGFGNANTSRVATIEDLNNQSNFSRLESQVQNNGNLTEMKFDGLTKGLCDLGYSNMVAINNVEKNLTAQIGALSTKIDANKIESLQEQVNQLQLQNAVAGVVRYPTATTYCSGANPFCNCGCNCGF